MSATTSRAAAQEASTTTQRDFAIIGATLMLIAVILWSLASPVLAQGTSETQGFINPKDIKWGAAPPAMPKGAKIAVLQGDPSKPGPFVMRLLVPAGYKIPPHWHTQDESLTVISGTFYFGTGEKVETSRAHTLTPAPSISFPGKTTIT